MITVKKLSNSALVDEASALLYKVYIEQMRWNFNPNSPSQLRIETRNNRKFLVDRFTKTAHWFGAFDDDQLVGCARLCGVDENNQLEIESYPASQPVHQYLSQEEKSTYFEITKVATRQDYVGKGIVKILFLALFNYCEETNHSVIACTHNGYLKALFKKIDLPLKKEFAFRYEPQDSAAVNFYFADFKKLEITKVKRKLEYLQNDLTNNSSRIFRALETVEPILPTPFYWMDKSGVVLGINELCLKAIGTTRDIIGKKPYAFYKKEIADHILEHNTEVIKREEILSQEEWIEDVTTKEVKCFSSVKAPLYDDEGRVIGIVGSSMEITAQKEAEQLRIKNEQLEFENKTHKLIVETQAKFQQIASQVAHDIRSPLASLLMLMKASEDIPEKERLAIRQAITTIEDIANNLLNQYKNESNLETESAQAILVSSLLLELITAKKYQYPHIQLTHEFSQAALFAFIHLDSTALKRAVSNIINNAVEALAGADKKILLTVDATEKELSLKIADNGKGIPIEVLNKIRQNTSITQGKTDGHGIGLTQVRQMVAQYKGQFSIDSTVDAGTTVTLTFPRVATPAWMAEKIILTPDNIIVILDDDKSIHTAWDSHLKELLVQYPLIKIHHFTQATDTLAFINNLPESDKAKVFLLTDYELLKQNYNGLDIIAAFPKNNSLLVTSHYANPEIQDKSLLCHTKILPKQLASDIPIQVISAEPQTTEEINYVFVDDDPNFFELAQICYLKNKPVKYYEDPKQFLKEMHHYSKEAKIFLDNRFTNANTTGLLLAEQLHNNGYKKIYLLSCDSFFPGDTPSYITPILKTDTERLKAALQ